MIPYIFNRTLYKSEYYVVKQNWLYRWLAQPDGTIHSRLNRWRHHLPALEYMRPMVRLCNQQNGDYLMLGLGGGSMLHVLQYKLASPKFDVVDINSEIICLAKQFFYIDTLRSTTIVESDAYRYINKCIKKYDVILIDLYQNKAYPEHCTTLPFFQTCQNLLNPDGLVTINCANMSQYPKLLCQLRSIFNQSVVTIRIAHPRNVILVASNQPIQSLIDQIALKRLNWHTETGLVGVLKNY